MTITARIHIDLAPAVDDWRLLFVDEKAHRQLWLVLGDDEPRPSVRLTIGTATGVYWHDKRALLLLAGLDSLIVEGSDPRGVKAAVDAIQECRAGRDADASGQGAA